MCVLHRVCEASFWEKKYEYLRSYSGGYNNFNFFFLKLHVIHLSLLQLLKKITKLMHRAIRVVFTQRHFIINVLCRHKSKKANACKRIAVLSRYSSANQCDQV